MSTSSLELQDVIKQQIKRIGLVVLTVAGWQGDRVMLVSRLTWQIFETVGAASFPLPIGHVQADRHRAAH